MSEREILRECLFISFNRKELCNKLLVFYNSLKKRISPDFPKEEKAQQVFEAAVGLKAAFKELKGDDFTNYYLHAATDHLPDQIRECYIDVFEASGCAIEHLHKDIKQCLL